MKYIFVLLIVSINLSAKGQEKEALHWLNKWAEIDHKEAGFVRNNQMDSFHKYWPSLKACQDSVNKYVPIWLNQLDKEIKETERLVQLTEEHSTPFTFTGVKNFEGISTLAPMKDTIVYPETSVKMNISCYHKKRHKKLFCKYDKTQSSPSSS
jgi:hypothetical protein